MAYTYTYTISTDFPEGVVFEKELKKAIKDSSIATNIDGVNITGADTVEVVFDAQLSAGDKTDLDADISAPCGGLISTYAEQIEVRTKPASLKKGKLKKEINDSGQIGDRCKKVKEYSDTKVAMYFDGVLSSGDKTDLTALVAAHAPADNDYDDSEIQAETSAPTVNQDITEGYEANHHVVVGNDIYLCLDNTEGAAVWTGLGIVPDAVTTVAIIDDAVTTPKILNDAVTQAKIAPLAVDTPEIANSAVDTLQLANDAVTIDKIANASVDTAQIVDAAINTAKLDNNAVDTLKIANDAVTVDKIANDAVDSAQIADASVDLVHMSVNSVDTVQILDDAVTYAKIQNIAADQVLLGNIAGTNKPAVELTVAQIKSMLGIISVNTITINTDSDYSKNTTSATYVTVATFTHGGVTAVGSPTQILADAWVSTGNDGMVRVYDITNNEVIAENIAINASEGQVTDLGTIGTIDNDPAQYAIQIANSDIGTTYIGSVTIIH